MNSKTVCLTALFVIPTAFRIPQAALSSTFQIQPASIGQDYSIIQNSTGFNNGTEYMPLNDLSSALNKIGVKNYLDGNDWYLNRTQPSNTADSDASGPGNSGTSGSGNSDISGSGNVGTSGSGNSDTSGSGDSDSSGSGNTDTSGSGSSVTSGSGGSGTSGSFDPNKPIIIHDKDQTSKPINGINVSGAYYFPIWYLMQFLKADGYFTTWNGTTLFISKNNIYNIHSVVNPHQRYTYTQLQKDIATLSKMYPDLIHSEVVGQTAYGRNIYAVSIGKGNATAFINGSHHAREWITTNLNMYMIDQYAYAYEKNQTIGGYNVRGILDKTTLWFIPMVNPDGVTLEQYGANAFPENVRHSLILMNHGSTNFTDWKANAEGIDPNRQYDGGWYQLPFVVNGPWFESYKGRRPYQINEVKAVIKLINQINPQEEIAYHASGSVIYWGFQISKANYATFRNYASKLSRLTGYPLSIPAVQARGGGLTDWWTHNVGRPGFTIEVGPAEGSNPVPIAYFNSIWNQNKAVGLQLAVDSYNLYLHHPNSSLNIKMN